MHIVTTLDAGGAELFLLRLLAEDPRLRESAHVVSLAAEGSLTSSFEDVGIPVTALGMTGARSVVPGLARARKLVAVVRPDLVQTWLYHADLLGTLAAVGRAPVIWNLRDAEIRSAHLKAGTVAAMRACALMSRRLPARIVCCSEAAARDHAQFGYARQKMTVIRNGFDTDRFAPVSNAFSKLRAECGIQEDSAVVGQFARWHPKKGHLLFLRAMGPLLHSVPTLHIVMGGREVCNANAALRAAVDATPAPERVHLLGHRDDMAELLPGLDVLVSPSYSEGMPNVVGEAMACGVPCIVTDVGDSAHLVGATGRVVPPADPGAIEGAVKELLFLTPTERRKLGRSARQRIIDNFSLSGAAAQYLALYEEVSRQRR